MIYSVLYGSVREDRQCIRAALFIERLLKDKGFEVNLIDAKEYELPFLDKMYKEYNKGKAPENMEQIAQLLKVSDGFIIVSGEYNHSIPPALKNLLDHFQQEYYFKPSGIVSYSAGAFAGLRAAVHLRAVLAELGMSSIPSILPIPKVQNSFNEQGETENEYILKSANRFIKEFEWYANALSTQRKISLPY